MFFKNYDQHSNSTNYDCLNIKGDQANIYMKFPELHSFRWNIMIWVSSIYLLFNHIMMAVATMVLVIAMLMVMTHTENNIMECNWMKIPTWGKSFSEIRNAKCENYSEYNFLLLLLKNSEKILFHFFGSSSWILHYISFEQWHSKHYRSY